MASTRRPTAAAFPQGFPPLPHVGAFHRPSTSPPKKTVCKQTRNPLVIEEPKIGLEGDCGVRLPPWRILTGSR